jgi:DNA modification methylase
MNIEYVKIKELQGYEFNTRTHSDSQVNQLAASIGEFGFTNPLLIDGERQIIAGHGRFAAATKLQMDEVPCIVLDHLSEAQRRAYVIVDNKLALNAGWDEDLLKLELSALDKIGFDLSVVGFDADELSGLVIDEDIAGGLTDEDDVPEVPEDPISKVGDIWLLGEHRVMCGDSTNGGDVALLMNGEKADMVFTDPPYGVDFQSNYRTKSEKFEVLKNDNVFLDGWIPLVNEYSNGFVFVWTSWKVVKDWIDICKPIGDLSNMIVWSKGGGGIGDLKKTFSTDYEIALVYHRETQLTGKRLGSVWSINKDGAATYKHPTQKPVELTEMALDSCSVKNNLIMDLFLGSGSTLIAAEKKNRKCYGMELDSKYIDVIIKRWQEYTGKIATHAETGVCFNEVADAK